MNWHNFFTGYACGEAALRRRMARYRKGFRTGLWSSGKMSRPQREDQEFDSPQVHLQKERIC